MKRYLSIILFLVINLCCSACVPRTINTEAAVPNQGAPSKQAHENQPDLENENEQSLSKTEHENNGNSSPENSKEIPHPRFVKIEVGAIEIGIDYIHGVFALNSNGDLYFAAEDGNLELIETNVKDFSNGSFLYLLKENGDVMKSQHIDYQKSPLYFIFYFFPFLIPPPAKFAPHSFSHPDSSAFPFLALQILLQASAFRSKASCIHSEVLKQ